MVDLPGHWILNCDIRSPIMIHVVDRHDRPVRTIEQFARGEPGAGEGQQIDLTVMALRYDLRVPVAIEVAGTAYLPVVPEEQVAGCQAPIGAEPQQVDHPGARAL